MSERPVFGHPDFTVRIIAELLLDNDLKCLPIVDDRGNLAGIVTQGDLQQRANMPARLGLLRSLKTEELTAWFQTAEELKGSTIMTPNPRAIRMDRFVTEAFIS